MSEYQYTPYPPINKEIPTTYPIPKCEPKKVIHLPPAATRPDLGMDPSYRFRNSEKPRSPPQSRPVPNLPYSKDQGEYTDRHSNPTSPRAHRHGSSSSRHVASSATDPSASRHGTGSGRASNPGGAAGPHSRREKVEERNSEGHGDTKDKGKSYGAPKTATRGSTIPRQGKVNSVRSPLSRSGARGYGGSTRSRPGY